jgi:hypothetical protein
MSRTALRLSSLATVSALGNPAGASDFDKFNFLWYWIETYWFVVAPVGIAFALFLFVT